MEIVKIKTKYVLTMQEERAIIQFLKGNTVYREMADIFGLDHPQKMKDLLIPIFKQWYFEGKLKIDFDQGGER